LARISFDAMLRDSISNKQTEEFLRLYREPLKEEVKIEEKPLKIFISFSEYSENIYLVEQLLDPFLSHLSFDVHYWRKDQRIGIPTKIIEDIIDNCDGIIALYTKDDKIEGGSYRSTGNVTFELGRARLPAVILCEKGTKIESMPYSTITVIHFERGKFGQLFLDLLKVLKNSRWIDIKTSMP